MAAHRNKFIDGVGLSETTSLTHLLDSLNRDDDNNDELQTVKHSPYYSEAEFTRLLSTKAGLTILDLNIRNIRSNFDELELFINRVNISNPISAICLNECWLGENTPISDIHLPNYTMFIKKGNLKGHGHCGLIIYIHEQFVCKEVAIYEESTAWEYMCVEISHRTPNSRKYLLCNIYRIPKYTIDDVSKFTDEFSSFLTSIKNMKRSTFISGDFNVNLLSINSKRHFNNFFESVIGKGFFPRITLPTRLQNESYTLIDNIFSNIIEENIKVNSGILINQIGHTDHQMIFTYHENISYMESNEKYITIEKKDETSIQNFIDELKSQNICDRLSKSLNGNPQDTYRLFSELLKYAREKHFPQKKVKFNKKKHKKSPWMTNAILNCINTKNKLYKNFIQCDIEKVTLYNNLKSEYKEYRAMLRKNIREAKRIYFLRKFNMCKNDIKKTWLTINDTLNTKSKKGTCNEFVSNNQTITDPDEIAHRFNEYFINIGHSLSDQIRPMQSYTQYLTNHTPSRFTLHQVNDDHIGNIIDKLKNKSSCGHDNISNKLIKQSKDVLVKPLTLLVNQMLSSGCFPDDLKISRVKPLYKAGDTTLFSNYRPISLLPSVSKIFEYAIYYQLIEYLQENNLLYIEQYGFRPGHSTELACIRLIDHIAKQVDSGKIPINIYIDLSKAFDTLNHTILLEKLKHYGICGSENDLLRDYLSNRCQYVEYSNSKSASKPIVTGVPQGSILGPILFLIYINDLPLVSNMFDMLMYADDTTLYCNINQYTVNLDINSELNKISAWLASNKLSLNVKKTKFMVFHTAQRKIIYPKLIINNVEIEMVRQFNFLGIILSSTLKWHNHISHISKKISKVIGVMHRLKCIFPQAILLTLYNALIVPHFTYGLLVWGSKIIKNHSLHLVQKKALRIVTNRDYIAHSEPICKRLRLLQVPDMFRISMWKFYYKLMNNKLPLYFSSMKPELPVVCDTHVIRHPTFHLPKIVHEFAEQLLKYQLIKLLNNEKCSILITGKVHTHSFCGFKMFIKNTVIDSYLDNCNVPFCESCLLVARRQIPSEV